MKTKFLFLLAGFVLTCSFAEAQPKREVRAVWLTVNHNLDWPQKPASTPTEIRQQKADLDRMLDRMKKANINLVFFQTRIRGNVVYHSKIEPYTELIKSKSCPSDFDALEYAIQACHKRGMEIHAWFVVYPLGKNNSRISRDLSKSGAVIKYKNEYYINPGHPKTTPYLVKLLREMTENYDIDGVHFDYIRYPDGAAAFPDSEEYKRYGKGESLEVWRRKNINSFVYEAYNAVKAIKPQVAVSSSVVGMYDFLPDVSKKHWTALHSVYQDPADWVQKGKHDFIVPMLYNRDKMFFPFVKDWILRCGRDRIIPGLGIYMIREAGWKADVITAQIDSLRNIGINGCAFFRAQNFIENLDGIYDSICAEYFFNPSLLPVFNPAKVNLPLTPDNFSVTGAGDYLLISWNKPDSGQPLTYNIYRSDSPQVDINNPANLIEARLTATDYRIPINNKEESVYYYTVTSCDRFHNESMPCGSEIFVYGNLIK